MNDRSIVAMFRVIRDRWITHDDPRLAAALAYYTILSLAPMVILLVAVVAMLFGDKMARNETIDEVQRLIGRQASGVVATLVDGASRPSTSITAGLLATLVMLVGASSVFLELRSALNVIWDVQEPACKWYTGLIKERLFSFAMVVVLGLVMMVSLGFSVAIAVVGRFFAAWLPLSTHLLRSLNNLAAFVLTGLVFALIFRFVPDKRIGWSDAAVGALATAALFDLARVLLDLYLSRAGVGSAYGAAGSLVVFLFWVYCSAQMFYMGGEFTRAYAEHYGGLSRGVHERTLSGRRER